MEGEKSSNIKKQGSLKSSSQISPQEFLSELKSGATDEKLFACLDSLRVSLTSNPVSSALGVWARTFWLSVATGMIHDRPCMVTMERGHYSRSPYLPVCLQG
ncbi:hypothetical protein SRHO_G00171470 [Serrasalmus rhombeus]